MMGCVTCSYRGRGARLMLLVQRLVAIARVVLILTSRRPREPWHVLTLGPHFTRGRVWAGFPWRLGSYKKVRWWKIMKLWNGHFLPPSVGFKTKSFSIYLYLAVEMRGEVHYIGEPAVLVHYVVLIGYHNVARIKYCSWRCVSLAT